MDVVVELVAGLDVGKASVTVCVRVPGPGKVRVSETRTYSTRTRQIRYLAEWLDECGVELAAMESTATDWKPVVRHEALWNRVEVRDSAAGQSQLLGEAEGSRDVGTHATVGSSLTTYGTGRHCQTARVRQAR